MADRVRVGLSPAGELATVGLLASLASLFAPKAMRAPLRRLAAEAATRARAELDRERSTALVRR